MDFMGIGTWELMMIGLVALIVLGPKQMILLARKAGELLRQFQDIWQEASKTIDKEIKAIESEAGDLTTLPKEITALTNEMRNAFTLDVPANGKSVPPAGQSIRPPAASAWSPSSAPIATAAETPVDGSGAPSHPDSAGLAGASSELPPAPPPAAQPADAPAQYSAWVQRKH